MIIIPTFQNASARFTQKINLDGTRWILKFDWNSRSESWYMSISDIENNIVIAGIKMVPNYLLLRQYRYYETCPDGEFVLVDLEQFPGDEVTFENFGIRYVLVFLTTEEFEEFQ